MQHSSHGMVDSRDRVLTHTRPVCGAYLLAQRRVIFDKHWY